MAVVIWHSLGMSTDLYRFLRAHRRARKLTLEYVASAIGIRQNTLSQWDTGARAVDLNDLEKLAAVYNVSPMALLAAPEDSPRADAMRQAADLAARMDEEALADWLRMGERVARDSGGEKNHEA